MSGQTRVHEIAQTDAESCDVNWVVIIVGGMALERKYNSAAAARYRYDLLRP
jgi:hypothetical protein